jgi:hypothetical protein
VSFLPPPSLNPHSSAHHSIGVGVVRTGETSARSLSAAFRVGCHQPPWPRLPDRYYFPSLSFTSWHWRSKIDIPGHKETSMEAQGGPFVPSKMRVWKWSSHKWECRGAEWEVFIARERMIGGLEEVFSCLTLKSEMRGWMRGQLVSNLTLQKNVVVHDDHFSSRIIKILS